jgi:hypothetical protein
MPNEDDRFGDVADQLKQTEETEVEKDESIVVEDEAQSTPDAPAEKIEEKSGASQEQVESNEEEPEGGPAFPFDVTDMHGFYVREETWGRIIRMRSSVTAACSLFDVPEFEGREFQDACLQVIANHGEEVALQILRERGIEPDEKRVQEVVEMLSNQAENG